MFSQGFAVPTGLLVSLLKPLIKVRTFCSGLCLGSRAVLQRTSLHGASSSSLDSYSGAFCPRTLVARASLHGHHPQLLQWAAVGCRGGATCGDPWLARAARTQELFLFGLSGLFLELSVSFAAHDCPPILSSPLSFLELKPSWGFCAFHSSDLCVHDGSPVPQVQLQTCHMVSDVTIKDNEFLTIVLSKRLPGICPPGSRQQIRAHGGHLSRRLWLRLPRCPAICLCFGSSAHISLSTERPRFPQCWGGGRWR